MSPDITQQKWDARYLEREVEGRRPCEVLTEYAHLLPEHGRALDAACGLGANALFLAARGLEVAAWDISPVAIEKLTQYARQHAIPLHTAVRDITRDPPAPLSFDIIVVSYFLHRPSLPALIDALKPGGLLYYQTHTLDKIGNTGPNNPEFLLKSNEMLGFSGGLTLRAYREEGRAGDTRTGLRNAALLVAEKG